MDLARPHSVIATSLDTAALSVLSRTTEPLSGHQVARIAPEGSQQGIAKALGRLVEQGLVLRREVGRAHLYELNRDHIAAPAVKILAELRTELFARLRANRGGLGGRSRSRVGLRFRRAGGGRHGQDAGWRGQLDELGEVVRSWTGNPASLSELSEDQLRDVVARGEPIVDGLVSDAITLMGLTPAELLASPA